ncbi:sigma-70 family RNA polymerase sigma factor [Curvivirga sp.]|uniref:sigma-70 family RNA polymerase sigma factor n=1 Tax=Curvivirga sp. TaxID=2856848 RepID=UPI003B5999B3
MDGLLLDSSHEASGNYALHQSNKDMDAKKYKLAETLPAVAKLKGALAKRLTRHKPESQKLSPETDSDEALMVLVVQGDKSAYRKLVERHVDRTVALAKRIVSGDSDAEDIAQDVFLNLWKSKEKWNPEKASFRTWLYRMTLNRAIDYQRKTKFVNIEDVQEPEDERPNAETHIQQNQVSARIRDAIKQLSETQQVAISLYYHEGLTAAQVAEVMGIKLNAAESLLKRARQRLREIMKDQQTVNGL